MKQWMDGGDMAPIRASTVQQKRSKGFTRPCGVQPDVRCLVDDWHEGEERTPKPKAQWVFVTKKKSEAEKHRLE